MRSSILASLFLAASLTVASAAVVHPAPDVALPSAAGKGKSLRSFRGQPVVLIITKSPKYGDFKKQAKYLYEIYQQFASKQVVFIAAFTEEKEPVKTDIPFVVAENGAAAAGAFGVVDKFAIVIIGKDGNIDYQTNKVLAPERVRDVIQNSYEIQAHTGRN